MSRTGLAVALVVAVVVGVMFGVCAQLDLDLAALFFDRQTQRFAINAFSPQPWAEPARDAARWLVALLVAPAFIAICGKLILPRRRMLIGGRASLFLAVSLALGPGVLTNVILKTQWARSRPIDVTFFGGTERFMPWWDPRGDCSNNCSFVSGEGSGAFWVLAPAALTPPQWRILAYSGALVFGSGIGVLRMASGAHFFTDVVFAGVLMFLLAWILYALIYRWRLTRITDIAIEHQLAATGVAMRDAVTVLADWVRGRADRR